MRALLRFLAINGKETNDPHGIDVVGGLGQKLLYFTEILRNSVGNNNFLCFKIAIVLLGGVSSKQTN